MSTILTGLDPSLLDQFSSSDLYPTVTGLPPIGASSPRAAVPIAEVNNPGTSSPINRQYIAPAIHQQATNTGSAGVVNSSGDRQFQNHAPGSSGVVVTHIPGGIANSTGNAQLPNLSPGHQGVQVSPAPGRHVESFGNDQLLNASVPVPMSGPPLAANVMADRQNHARHSVAESQPLPFLAVNVNAGVRRSERSGAAPSDVIIK